MRPLGFAWAKLDTRETPPLVCLGLRLAPPALLGLFWVLNLDLQLDLVNKY